MSVLIVVSHPDDEALGCGGTAAALAKAGIEIRACILSGAAQARSEHPGNRELYDDTVNAQKILGLGEPVLGDFPNIEFNTVPHLELVQFIESAIVEYSVTSIFTHHPWDLNEDHRCTSLACQAAARLAQRRRELPALQSLLYMEVPSATDWAFDSARDAFRPDTYFDVTSTFDAKLEALRSYRGVMRPPPHPRSEDYLRALAIIRGGESGTSLAEAFQSAFRALRSTDLT
jgi:LmbE family N-acetylglucosaminyl deacetylase